LPDGLDLPASNGAITDAFVFIEEAGSSASSSGCPLRNPYPGGDAWLLGLSYDVAPTYLMHPLCRDFIILRKDGPHLGGNKFSDREFLGQALAKHVTSNRFDPH
jgi:hypothetical protein